MSKRFLAVVLALVIAVAAGSVVGCGGSDAVVTVGDVGITEEQLDAQAKSVASQYSVTEEDNPEYYAQLKTDVLEGLIDNEVAVQKASEFSLSVTDEELQTEIDSMVSYYYSGDQSLLEESLKTAGMSMDEFRAEYEKYILVQKVYDAVVADVTVSDQEISDYYDANIASYAVEDTRTTRHILIQPGNDDSDEASTTTTAGSATTTTEWTDSEWDAALAVAQQVRAELVAGGDWTTLAAEYSDDSGSKDSGGDLGEVTKGEMVAEFEDATFSLDAYEISQPVKSVYGYHIIQVTGITAAHTKTLEEVKSEISDLLLSEAQNTVWMAWLDKGRAELGVEYREDMQPTTTVAPASTTTTTAAGNTITTAGPATTTTD